jgi:hypothetical protein
MKSKKIPANNSLALFFGTVALLMAFSIQAHSKMNSTLEISTNPDGSVKISDVLLDESGQVIGVPQTSLTDTSGSITGETESAAAPSSNQPPVISSVTVHCFSSGTGTVYGAATDPDGILNMLQFIHGMGGEPITGACPGACQIMTATSVANMASNFNHTGTLGQNITFWFRATDDGGLFTDQMGGCFVSP